MLSWDKEELKSGKIINTSALLSVQAEQSRGFKIKKFPQAKKVKLFRVSVGTDRTDFIATNDLSQDSTEVVPFVCKVCFRQASANDGRLSPVHRELKQLTGIESCQCRKGRIQRNHIACAI
ncbi:hypothetical protein [uncultured Nostoc sp.]|uniref:hypothetical protein n=1 Tax=uncultured Nostoc sp. TaxID=340711 RepID=UPI0035C9D16E